MLHSARKCMNYSKISIIPGLTSSPDSLYHNRFRSYGSLTYLQLCIENAKIVIYLIGTCLIPNIGLFYLNWIFLMTRFRSRMQMTLSCTRLFLKLVDNSLERNRERTMKWVVIEHYNIFATFLRHFSINTIQSNI